MDGLNPEHFNHFFDEAVEGDVITHVNFFPPKDLKVKNLKEFYNTYCNDTVDLQEKDLDQGFPRLGVIYRGIVPLVLRVTLKFDGDLPVVNYERFLMGITREAQKCIEKLFELSEPVQGVTPEKIAFILEGNDIFYQGETICKAMIHFPQCRSEHTNFLERFYPMIQERVRNEDTLNLLDVEFRESLKIGWNQILDPDEFQSPLPLYLSVVNDIFPPPEVSHIYPDLPEDLDTYDDADDININNILDPRFHPAFEALEGMPEGELPENINHYYPLLFDKDYMKNHVTRIIPEAEMMPKTPFPANVKDEVKKGRSGRGRCLDICKEMIEILKQKPENLREYKDLIGRAIHGSDHLDNSRPTKEGEELFIELLRFLEGGNFSLRKAKISYKDLRNGNIDYTFKTICYITKLKMKQEFEHWKNDWVKNAITEALQKVGEPNKLAEVIYREFFMDFLVSSYGKDEWYFFNGNTWIACDKSVKIRRHIQEFIVPKFEKLTRYYARKRDEENDDRRKRQFTLDIEATEALIKKLSSNKGINELVVLLREMFYEENFLKNQNKNEFVTGIKNGVLEARKEDVIFRPGFPEDYITKQMDAFYDDFSWTHPSVIFLMKWFRQMWPENVVQYYLKFMSSTFIAKNQDKIFLIFTGTGDNGKGQLNILNLFTFGIDYYVDIASEAFSRKKMSASGPTQELEDCRDTRVATVNEPGDDFYSEMLKKISGNDRFRSRGLNEKGGLQKPTYKLMIFSNKPPGLEGEGAILRRLRVIECKAKYMQTGYPENPEDQQRLRRFPMDTEFDQKLTRVKDAYLWILTQMYSIYRRDGLVTPKEMEDSARKYWKKYDVVKQFVEEYISFKDITGRPLDDKHTIPINDLYKIFNAWYGEIYPNKQTLDVNKFTYILAQKGIDMDDDETVCRAVRNKKMTGGFGGGNLFGDIGTNEIPN